MMDKKLPGGRFRIVLSLLAVCLLTGVVLSVSALVSSHSFLPMQQSDNMLEQATVAGPDGETQTVQKMIVANGSVAMDIDLNRLSGGAGSRKTTLSFAAGPDAFFTILVVNNELRGTLPGAMTLIPQNSPALPARLNASYHQLVVESMQWGGPYDLAVRDGKTGFVFFNVEGHQFNYDADDQRLSVEMGRLLISPEFAAELGRPSKAGSIVGSISISATMRTIEITQVVNGQVRSDVLPPLDHPDNGTVPGPDVIVGDVYEMAQFGGSAGTQVGLAIGTESCNAGTIDLDWFQLPNNDHPVIAQNLYRMSPAWTNYDRVEQIGQSNVKHTFEALGGNLCGFGCDGVSGDRLGSGCSDPYGAGYNSGPDLGSRAWIDPFTGAFPRGDSGTPPNDHSGHAHLATSHRLLTEIDDLNNAMNPGANYYAEAQYVTPYEYVWCQSHPGQCNMYNNVSYRRFSVTGTGSPFSFSPLGPTVRTQPAVMAWPGATFVPIQPDPGNDGIGVVAYKVTSPADGVWHYEYAIYNENIDRAIRSFTIPMAASVSLTNIGFHAPPQHPGWTFDGTAGNLGFSKTPWAQTRDASAVTWSSETFAQNPNANAIRWGTMYNIRFDSDRPPATKTATIGFFKTGAPITVQVLGPRSAIVPCIVYNPDTAVCFN